jgi:ketosteroid isomerase-like protein
MSLAGGRGPISSTHEREAEMATRVQTVRDCYHAYETGDRSILERNLAQDFVFSAPPDVGINREQYFERCWPNHETHKRFEYVRLFEANDEVYVTYEAETTDGRRFRNTEIHGFEGAQVASVEVYFGWNLE